MYDGSLRQETKKGEELVRYRTYSQRRSYCLDNTTWGIGTVVGGGRAGLRAAGDTSVPGRLPRDTLTLGGGRGQLS